jgi:hypothetical protein
VAASSKRPVVRPYEDRDLDGFLALRPLVYPGWREATDVAWHLRIYDWLARGPAAEHQRRWVIEDEGRIVGHLAAVPLPYRIGGRRLIAHTPTDYMALPGYGFHAGGLMRTFFRTTDSYVACNLVGEISRIERALGATPVAELRHAAKPLDLGSYPRRPRAVPALATAAAGRVLRLLDVARLAAAGGGPRVEIVHELDQSFDTLRDRVAAAVPCMLDKDAAFLTWRYGPGAPRQPFLTFAVRDGNVLLGYAVTRTTIHREGFVLDLVTLPGRDDVARSLLGAAIHRFWEDRAFIVRYRFLPSPASARERDLRRLGFSIRSASRPGGGLGHERFLELLERFADPEASAIAGQAENWAYNLGDGEASFWVH